VQILRLIPFFMVIDILLFSSWKPLQLESNCVCFPAVSAHKEKLDICFRFSNECCTLAIQVHKSFILCASRLPPSLTFFSLVVSFAPTYLLKHLRKACEIVVAQSSSYLLAFWDGAFDGAWASLPHH
jgi:hypothetical protein